MDHAHTTNFTSSFNMPQSLSSQSLSHSASTSNVNAQGDGDDSDGEDSSDDGNGERDMDLTRMEEAREWRDGAEDRRKSMARRVSFAPNAQIRCAIHSLLRLISRQSHQSMNSANSFAFFFVCCFLLLSIIYHRMLSQSSSHMRAQQLQNLHSRQANRTSSATRRCRRANRILTFAISLLSTFPSLDWLDRR